MTNAIPKGSCNLPVNIDVRERAVWSKLAFDADKSVGSVWREAMLEWLQTHHPDLGATVAKIRENRREVIRTGAATFLLALGLHIGWQSMQPDFDDHDIYRARGAVRVWRVRKLAESESEGVCL